MGEGEAETENGSPVMTPPLLDIQSVLPLCMRGRTDGPLGRGSHLSMSAIGSRTLNGRGFSPFRAGTTLSSHPEVAHDRKRESGKSPEPWIMASFRVLGRRTYYALHWIRWITWLAPGAFMIPCLIAAMGESKPLRLIDPRSIPGLFPEFLESFIDISR